jgi:hypothetical protein
VIAAAVVAHLWLQAGVALSWSGFTTSDFRNYYSGDQLSYLAIATDVAQGRGSSVEPYTLTGSIYYPREYYVVLGHLARLTSSSPAAMWLIVGLLVQALLVAAIGTTIVLLTRRWWAGALAFTPFVLGTGSWLIHGHNWATQLDSHAVLWGPAGVMYTLNGETVALSLGACAALGLLLVGAGRVRGRAAWVVAVVACLVAGALASVQTYGFLTTVYVLAGGTAAVGLVRSRSRWALAATVGLAVVLVATGPLLASSVSPLATLALGLLPTIPGLVVVLRLTRWRALVCFAALALGAAPQVVTTALGVLDKDPFLIYRQSSSKNLGVPLSAGLWAAMAVIPVLVLLVWLGVRHRRVLWVAGPAALATVWTLLASNDHWGANQEPYRLWLDVYVLVAILVVPLAAWAAVAVFLGIPDDVGPADDPDRGGEPVHEPGRWSLATRLTAAGAGVSVLVAGVWSVEFVLFRRTVADWGYVSLTGPRVSAEAELAGTTDGRVVLTDACIDPVVLKPVWGGPVAYFSPGLAWPAHKSDFDRVLPARADPATFDQAAAEAAGIGWLLVDASCELDLAAHATADLVATRTWSDDGGATVAGTLELWELRELRE